MTKGRSMTTSTRRLDTTDLETRVKSMYEQVATEPHQGFQRTRPSSASRLTPTCSRDGHLPAQRHGTRCYAQRHCGPAVPHSPAGHQDRDPAEQAGPSQGVARDLIEGIIRTGKTASGSLLGPGGEASFPSWADPHELPYARSCDSVPGLQPPYASPDTD